MRTIAPVFALLGAYALSIPAILAQTNPPPPDPNELVKRDPITLTRPADRSAALDLLERARHDLSLHDISSPYSLKVYVATSGDTQNEGEGTMDEFTDGASLWRWTAPLGDSLVVRIGNQDHVYGTNPDEPVPLRVQMLRAALHWPVPRNAGADAIRAAYVEPGGKALTCLLLSASIPPNPAPRSWVENEYCIDPATGLLQMWSEAPGIYVLYDYNDSAVFHGHILPRQISIFEDGHQTVHAQVASPEDAPTLDPDLFKPTVEMADAGGSFMLASPKRFPMRVDPSDAPTSTYFQPIIVHAILDAQDGHVLDAETLQNSDRDLSRAAMNLVKSTSFPPSGFQQEAFINVQFHMPAVEAGGPPAFHLSVHWVIWGHHEKTHPVRKPPRTAA